MDDSDISVIKKKSLSGILALTSRTFLLQIIAFGATFLLTIFLTPAIFGIFYVVSAVISFLTYFSDIGLAAALIQKKEALTDEDLRTTFTIQQILVVIIVIIALLFSDQIRLFYRLDVSGLWLFRALVVAFFLSSLKTIPSVILERKLDFQTLIIPQILETSVFYLIAVILAWRGYGITSFTYAVLARAIVGLAAIYALMPWRVSLGLSRPVAKKLMRFGIPFQMNSFLALIKDDLMTVFLGKILPFSQVGYIGWAKKWAEVPIRLIVDSIVKVTFPAFSRLQHSRDVLGKAIESTLFGLALTIFPISIGIVFFARPLIGIIPRYSKWEPAVVSLVLMAFSSAISSLSVPLTNTLNALGKIRTTLKLMVLWTVLTWVLTVVLIYMFGFNGVALAYLIITVTIALVVYLVKKLASFSFVHAVRYPVLGALLQSLWYGVMLGGQSVAVPNLVFIGITGVIIYIAIMWVTEKTRIVKIIGNFHQSI